MVILEGIAVSGELVDGIKDKAFTVIKAPHYVETPDLDNPSEMKRKLVLFVELGDESQMDYYPNKTSQKTMANLWGFETDKWLGKKFLWNVHEQNVRGDMKKVLFVLAKKFNNGKKRVK